MTTTKRLAAYAILCIACLPIFMVFNGNEDSFYINLIGIAYFALLYKYGRRIAPKFITDALDEDF